MSNGVVGQYNGFAFIADMVEADKMCFCVGPQDGQPFCPCVMKKKTSLPVTPARGESMPQTREFWEARAMRDQELILEQKAEISKLKHTVNNLRQKLEKPQ